mmetsp:Transcript_62335/g.115704  ORF Transcript_62335/g.115704 Transcript_62335/m.115704 type:complete len:501 (+) Transcript_62335:117-1619(+)
MEASQEEIPAAAAAEVPAEGDIPPPEGQAKRAADEELDGPALKQQRAEELAQGDGDDEKGTEAQAEDNKGAGEEPVAPQGDDTKATDVVTAEPEPTEAAATAPAPKAPGGGSGIGLIGAAFLQNGSGVVPSALGTAALALPGGLGNGGAPTPSSEPPPAAGGGIPRGLKGIVMRPPIIDGTVVGSAATEAPTGACSKGSFSMATLLAGKGKGMFSGSSAPMNQPQTSLSFEIPAKRVKDILGVKGTNIKALKQLSRITKIDLQDRSDPATVTVHGTQDACEKAKHMVLSIAAGDQSVIGNIVETIDVDQRLVSKLIGAKGAAINQIKDASGCYLEVRETGNGQPPRVIMTGPRDAVERAKDLVMRFLIEQTQAVNQQAAVATAAAGLAGLPGLGADSLAALGIDAQAQLQAQLLLQAQLAQLAQAGGGLPQMPGMPGAPALPPELAMLQQQAQGGFPMPPQQDANLLLQQAMIQQAQLTQGMPPAGGMGMPGMDPNAPQG